MSKKNKFTYISRDIKSGEIINIKQILLDKNQEEFSLILKEYNSKATVYINELLLDPKNIEIALVAIDWKTKKTLETISNDLDYIYDLVSDVKYEVEHFLEEEKDKKNKESECPVYDPNNDRDRYTRSYGVEIEK